MGTYWICLRKAKCYYRQLSYKIINKENGVVLCNCDNLICPRVFQLSSLGWIFTFPYYRNGQKFPFSKKADTFFFFSFFFCNATGILPAPRLSVADPIIRDRTWQGGLIINAQLKFLFKSSEHPLWWLSSDTLALPTYKVALAARKQAHPFKER